MADSSVVNRFHRVVLSWDYFELCERAEEGLGAMEELPKVPDTFETMEDYKKVFEPLVLEEVSAHVLRGSEEGVVLSPHPTVVSAFERKDDFLFVRLTLEEGISEKYGDNDLVLLSKDNPESEDCQTELSALGFCEAHEGHVSLRVKFYVTDDSQAGNTKGLTRVRAMRAGLETTGSCWWLLRLTSFSTITREWSALQNAHLTPFRDILLAAVPREAVSAKHMDIPVGMRRNMEKQCNPSQMDALQAGLNGTPMVLIQGPPGTGKTRTILNLLSVVMHSATKGSIALMAGYSSVERALTETAKHNLWMAQNPWLAGKPTARDLLKPKMFEDSDTDCFGLQPAFHVQTIGKTAGPKAHMLVCAPSNSALDEIVMRILASGLMDKDGNNFSPSIVRAGVNAHHSVKAVTLDALVDARFGAEGASKEVHRGERDRMRLAILDESSIVFSTLSYSGSPLFGRKARRFDVVVIDEAAQAVEPATLVPLVMGCKQVYLVGDPVQLPATVISARATDHGYDRSMFKRLQSAGYPVNVLNVQYRMNPAISAFPSLEFYQGRLLDGPNVLEDTVRAWHGQPVFGPLVFYDVNGNEAIPEGSSSIINKDEVEMVLSVYRELSHRHSELRSTPSVAVISPYKAQVKLLRDVFKKALGEEGARMVDINTIDGFQGREKDVCIFSCVRSRVGRSIGFVGDERRINVGITRARCSLIVIGNSKALQGDEHWSNLIRHCKVTRCLYNTKKPFTEFIGKVLSNKFKPVEPSPQEVEEWNAARDAVAENRAAAMAALTVKRSHDDELEESNKTAKLN